MRDALLQFHRALYARLSAFPALLAYQHPSMPAAGVQTFDHVPPGSKYPYNVMESMAGVRDGVFAGDGADLTAQVGTWDNYQGTERSAAIAALIGAALEDPLEVAGWGAVQAEIENQFTVRQDGFRRVVHMIGADLVR